MTAVICTDTHDHQAWKLIL